jgi:hypothetical protein
LPIWLPPSRTAIVTPELLMLTIVGFALAQVTELVRSSVELSE